ncbi:MAG TPA: TIM44-like domain-containing protein, partial [Polyangia bacterium]
MKSRALLLLMVLVCVPLYALARPGGGQSYHAAPSHSSPSPSHSYSTGSSHSYSTGSSSSSGGGGSMSPGAALTLLVIVGVIVVIVLVTKKRGGDRAGVAVDRSTQAEGLAALRGQDAGFDEAAFAERAKGVMAKVNEAWIAGAMGPARRHISDGVYVRFQTQLQLLKAQGLKNAMADWSVVGCELLAAESDAKWDTVHVKMVGQARDADVPANLDAQQAMEKAKRAPLVRYEEVWSFLRKRGAKSKNGVPALEGRCPNCGADLPVSDVVRCEYCKAVVNSGEHDWVLAEITQPEEWRPWMTNAEIAGLAELQAKDPAVSRQELEDRASVVFWKWIDARVTGTRARFERFCLAPGAPPAERAALSQVAVGSSELVDVAIGQDGLDHCEIELVWSASENGGEPVNQTSRVVLARATDATSKGGLNSLDCPNCRGPLADSDLAKCNFCGEPL